MAAGDSRIDRRILKLYASLERIANKENMDNAELNELNSVFDSFFDKLNKQENENTKNRILKTVESESFLKQNEIAKERLRKINEDERLTFKINGYSLLFRAMSIKKGNGNRKDTIDEIIKGLIKNFPNLIRLEHINDQSKGVTPVHLAIVQEDVELLELMAENIENVEKEEMKVATGDIFYGTIMMAGSLIGIATLKGNEKIFNIILEKFAHNLDVVHEKGDNIIHYLIKYVCIQPDKKETVLNMLGYILTCKFIRPDSKQGKIKIRNESGYFVENEGKYRKQVRKLLMMKNKEHLTPLQLATKRQQFEIFDIILNHEVYLSHETDGGVLQRKRYDITEIETLKMKNDDQTTHDEDVKAEKHESVLEFVLHHNTANAFLFSNVTPLKEVIEEKWKHYSCPFNIGFGFYLAFMVLLSISAVFRSQLKESVRSNDTAIYVNHVVNNYFVTSVSCLGLLFALILIVIVAITCCGKRFSSKTSTNLWKRIKNQLKLPYSTCIFRMYFLIFSVLLLVDFIFAFLVASETLPSYENYCLIFAVIIGWYQMLFFLQSVKSLSFCTGLIHGVMNDMLKMACIMAIFLIAFSIAMYMIMQGADIEEDDFDNLGKTVVKMVTIMLGIGELDVLFKARQPILAVLIFLLFVLLTTILLLNALIAIMSNTCTDLMSNFTGSAASKIHYRLQKLTLIVFLESFLPLEFCKWVGKEELMDRLENEKQIKRRIWVQHFVMKENEADMEPSEQPLQHLDKTDTFKKELMETFHKGITGRSKAKRLARQKSKNSDTGSLSLGRLPSVHTRLDIKDYEKRLCEKCKNETVTCFQSQEITELPEYIDTSKSSTQFRINP